MFRIAVPEIVEPEEGRSSEVLSPPLRQRDSLSDLEGSSLLHNIAPSIKTDSDLNLPELNLEDVDEGLNFALGTDRVEGAWFPLKEDEIQRPSADIPRIAIASPEASIRDEPDQEGIKLSTLQSVDSDIRQWVYPGTDEQFIRHSVDTSRSRDWQSRVRKVSQRLSGMSTDDASVENDAVDLLDEIDMNHNLDLHESDSEDMDYEQDAPMDVPDALYGHSMLIFGPENPIRLFCLRTIKAIWFEPAMFALLIATAVILSVQQWNPASTGLGYFQIKSYSAMDWVLVPIYAIFTLEMLFKMIAYGVWDDSQMLRKLNIARESRTATFWGNIIDRYLWFLKRNTNKNLETSLENPFERKLPHSVTALEPTPKLKGQLHRAYLRYEWNWVDLISILSWWISMIMASESYNLNHSIMVFRSLMCLKIYRLWNITNGTQTVLSALRRAAPELADVSIFLLGFWVFFAILGVQSFKASLRRQCVWTNPDDASDQYVTSQFCGSWLQPHTKKEMEYLNSDGSFSGRSKGFTCPVNSKCISSDNPYGGTVSFDNIFHSFELVFVIISANTFTDIMYDLMDTDSMASSLFFIAATIILTVWLVNLIVAVIINSFNSMNEHLKEQMENDNSFIWGSARWNKRNEEYHRFLDEKKDLWRFQKTRLFFTLVAIIGMCFAAVRTSRSSKTVVDMIYRVNCGVTILLFIEVLATFSLCLPNWRMFFKSLLNCVDLFFAVVTMIIALPVIHKNHHTVYAWLTVFQYARTYRIIHGIPFLRGLWVKALGNLRAFFDLCTFFILTLYLTSIVMSRLFEGMIPVDQYLDDDMLIMYNLPNVLISLYTITSTENWTGILYLAQQEANTTFTKLVAATYLILWFIFSNMFILNIFIAIITQNLGVSEKDKRAEQIKQFYRKIISITSDQGGIFESLRSRSNAFEPFHSKINREQMISRLKQLTDLDLEEEYQRGSHANRKKRGWLANIPMIFWNILKGLGNKIASVLQNSKFIKVRLGEDGIKKIVNKIFDEESDNVLFIFAPNNRIRMICQTLVAPPRKPRETGRPPNNLAKNAFMVLMFLATILMVFFSCFWTPLYRVGHGFIGARGWNFYVDILFGCLFAIEFAVKVVADGLIGTENACLRSIWDVSDAVVLLSIWLDIIAEIKRNSYLSTVVGGLRAVRALRLLTVTTLSKQTFQFAIMSGARKAIDAFLVSMSLLLPFSLWGLTIFNGKLGYCLDGESNQTDCKFEYSGEVFNWEVLSPNVYTNPYLNFNNFGMSLSSLSEIVSLEGWVDLLENLMNSTGVGTPPSTFASPFNGFFIAIFNFVSIVFILNLFVSVIINNYSRLTGMAFLTEDQLAWNEVKKILSQVKPSKKKVRADLAPFKRFCYDLTIGKNRYWASFLNVCLFIHAVDLLCEFYLSNTATNSVRYAAYVVSSTGFMANTLMVIYAMGLKTYIRNQWNAVSLFIVTGAFTLSIASYFVSRNTSFANINKLFLVSMLFFIIPRSDRLSQLLKFASASVPALASLLYTWLILFLVYAIALNQIFGLTKIGANGNGNLNCRTVTKCLILLFKMSFGEGWNYIMDDFTLDTPFCFGGSSTIEYSDCGNKVFAILLFGSWNIVSMYILLNILISLVVNSFSYVYHGSGPHTFLTREEIRKFKRAWSKFDLEGKGYIPTYELQPFMRSLEGELSFNIYGPRFRIKQIAAVWTYRKSSDPYDLDLYLDELNGIFKSIDWQKVKKRKAMYDKFIEESMMSVVSYGGEPMISFTKLLLQIGLYSRFDEATCLTLEDFLKRHLLHEKIENNLKQRKLFATLAMVIDRFRYKTKRYDMLLGDKYEPPKQIDDPFADPDSTQDDYRNYMFSSGVENPFT